jgi:hypothetical protein
MICQNCQKEEALVHISGTGTSRPLSGAASSSQGFELNFCEACAEEYHRRRASHRR